MDIHAVLIGQLQKIAQVDSEQVSELFGILPKRAPDLWRMLVVGAYLDDLINLSKAAELLGQLTPKVLEFFDRHTSEGTRSLCKKHRAASK